MPDMQTTHWDDIPEKGLAPGITGRYVHGACLTVGLVTIKAGSEMPLHSHPHEQVTTVHSGSLKMHVDGCECVLTAGMSLVIPPDATHSAEALTDVSLTDVFSPTREDYR